ncbi:DUF3137 domain-containing protein [Denitrobaculum tricleocarpae]|uniref:DUF3137 domain-containing protein n=1 Tax=Denitrobaculum tricleocarpae TaxID=2591009 RepID=A0A545TKL1_9PROT|nr:DUF3137 domain-containing protein [Denitrobaculum tricleocarpae]TQV77770.1 DUF3137 domain-containing protein [Denitrobaculum tricleocarpae]
MDLPSPTHTRSLLERFEAVFEEKIAPRLQARDHERVALTRNKGRNWAVIIAASAAATSIMFFLTRDVDSVFMALPVGAGVYWLLIARPTKRLTDSIKQEIFIPLCDALGFTYRLRPDGSNARYFTELRLVGGFNRSRFEDEVSGRYDDLDFSLVDAHLKDVDKDNSRTVFHGLLAAFEMTKSFRGRTLVLRDGGMLGNFLGGIGNKLERVRLEDPRFERAYEVYSSDQVEARYLLTPAFMDRLLDLERQLNSKVRLAFDRNSLLMSIELSRDAFNIGKLETPLSDKRRLLGIVKDLTMIFDVVETLRLNAETKL